MSFCWYAILILYILFSQKFECPCLDRLVEFSNQAHQIQTGTCWSSRSISKFSISYMIFFLTLQNMDATQSIDTLESMIREAALKVVNDCHSGRELSHMWPVEKSRVSPH